LTVIEIHATILHAFLARPITFPFAPSLCARRLPRPGRGVGVHPERLGAFRSLPSSFNVKLSTACPERRRVDSLFPQSPHQYHSMGLTFPLFSYSYALFCTAKNPNPFRFISFRTLCTKHPGWDTPCVSAAPAMKIAPCRRPLKSELVSYRQLSAVSCQPLFLFSQGATTTPATAPLSPLVTILDAVDAASSLSPAFATLTKNTRGAVSPSRSAQVDPTPPADLLPFRLSTVDGFPGADAKGQPFPFSSHPKEATQRQLPREAAVSFSSFRLSTVDCRPLRVPSPIQGGHPTPIRQKC
jgi:hypothetical protein